MKNQNPANVRFKAKKAVKPPMTLSFLAEKTGIKIGKLSQFINRGLEIEQEEVNRIYEVLLGAEKAKRNGQAVAV